MKCPYCQHADTQVTDSRLTPDANAIKRRRECKGCERRFTTYERIERVPLTVVKKDNSREPYKRDKIQRSIGLAVTKRKVSADQVEAAVDGIEAELYNRGVTEVSSDDVGELVMQRLRELDEVAYIRFASVYRNFADLDDMREEMEGLLAHPPGDEIEVLQPGSEGEQEPRKRRKRNGTK